MIVLLIHAGVTLYMAGLIWFVQVVHYPLMASVGNDVYADYQKRHERLTGLVVGPPMLTELFCALWIAIAPPIGMSRWLAYAGLAMLAIIWLSTFFLQVPCHRQLEQGFDPTVHHRLVGTNWIRTVGWSMRGVIALLMVGTIK